MAELNSLILNNETVIRLSAFIGIFVVMTLWELASPKRTLEAPRSARWPSNVAVVVIDSILLRLLFPLAAVGTAFWADAQGFGLMNWLALPEPIAVILCVIALDGAIYVQHVVFHKVPILWRLHRMHHADTGFDVTTALRFHPIEIILSMGIKMTVVTALGAPALAVVIFEFLLNGSAMFNHGNVRLPASLDRILRFLIVTPDMHRIHHSAERIETDSNYGFSLSIWDRLFRTYRDQPKKGQDGLIIGLEYFRDAKELRIDQMLIQPFKDAK